MTESDITVELSDDLDQFQQEVMDRGWGDGLPVIPPTADRVQAFCDTVGLAPDHELGRLGPGWGIATVEKVATNAVMAGCLPAHFPLVVAGVHGVAQTSFNLYGIQATTNPVTPFLLVNGPRRAELGLNYSTGAFGPGSRANATIGRALRLVLLNIGGARPGELDRATQGFPGKYTFCAAEHEERNPWGPYHVERGFSPEDTTVSVFGVQGYHNIIDLTAVDARELLDMLAAGMAAVGTNNMTHGGQALVVLSPEHAEQMERDGFDKDEVRRYLWERARIDLSRLPPRFQEFMKARRPGWVDQNRLPITDEPSEIQIVVVGGPGIHSAFLPMFGSTSAITVKIDGHETVG
jgi:hypothetical protein